jgi:ABC-type xylose transport system substrate-binding protein
MSSSSTTNTFGQAQIWADARAQEKMDENFNSFLKTLDAVVLFMLI